MVLVSTFYRTYLEYQTLGFRGKGEQMASNQLHNAYSKKYVYEVKTNRERAAQRVMSPLAFPYLFHDV